MTKVQNVLAACNYSITVDKKTEGLILEYIRKHIYKKYPAKSLQKSVYWIDKIKIEKNPEYTSLTAGGSVSHLYLKAMQYTLYFDDHFIASLDYEPTISVYLK